VVRPSQAECDEVIAAQYGLNTDKGEILMVKYALGLVRAGLSS